MISSLLPAAFISAAVFVADDVFVAAVASAIYFAADFSVAAADFYLAVAVFFVAAFCFRCCC